jgi:hypothetical protein
MIHRYTCDQTPRAPTRMQYVCVAATSLPTYDARARIASMQSLEEPVQETRACLPTYAITNFEPLRNAQ